MIFSESTQKLILQKLGLDSALDLRTLRQQTSERNLPAGREVLRMAPSPTGFVHIGTVYASLITERIARQSGGVFILRIEDTDTKREVDGSDKQIIETLTRFGIELDEGPLLDGTSMGDFGPYYQSQRSKFYNSHVVELLRLGRAYPCFATSEELAAMRSRQSEAKVRPGYYGEFAIWREKSEAEVCQALSAGIPFILRFRSHGDNSKRIEINDLLKGVLSLPEDDSDVPLLKSDGLPTYHLAHVVDDYLMQTTIVYRGDEWLPSTPLHIGLAQAFGYENSWRYAHFAPISIIDPNGGGKRKLSKRKDREANIEHFFAAGYPVHAIKDYFMGLASADFAAWRVDNPSRNISDFNIEWGRLAKSRSPLFDPKKLDDISKNYIGSLSESEYRAAIEEWADKYNSEFLSKLLADPDYTRKVMAVERQDGLENKRKDLRCFSDAPEEYGYFFDQDSEVSGKGWAQLDDTLKLQASRLCQAFVASYSPSDSRDEWFAKLKLIAAENRFAPDNQTFKNQPEEYCGTLADAAKTLRLLITGKTRTPDLWEICQVLGSDRIESRLSDIYNV